MGSLDGFPAIKDCKDTLVAFLFLKGAPPLTQVEVPWFPGRGPLDHLGPPSGGPPGPPRSPSRGPQVHLALWEVVL